MDSTMRDLDQIREVGDVESPSSRITLGTLALFCAIGVLVGLFVRASSSEPEAATDPFAEFGLMAQSDQLAQNTIAANRANGVVGSNGTAGHVGANNVDVDTHQLRFPTTLRQVGSNTVGLVPAMRQQDFGAAAAAAAQAELQRLGGTAQEPLQEIPAGDFASGGAQLQTHVTEAGALTLQAAQASGALVVHPESSARTHDDADAVSVGESQASHGSEGGEPATPGHAGDITLQVISYETAQAADAFAEFLRGKGHHAFVMAAQVAGRGQMHRVRIGPFTSMQQAQAYRRTFEADERMNTIVVRQSASP